MLRTFAILLAAAIPFSAFAEEKTEEIAFSKSDVDKLPKSWKPGKTGQGEGSVWKVVADGAAPSKGGYALAQTADGPNILYNLCVLDGSSFKDGEVSTMVRAVSGKLDQDGGIVWRYRDADNYYVCRYNPLETNLRVYHVKGGQRTQLATKEDLKAGEWFAVSIRHSGRKIACSIDGKLQLELVDNAFPEAGKVGVWSKADAQSHFDRFRFTPAVK